MKNFRAFSAIFVGQSNNTPHYVKLTDLRNRVTVKLSLFNTSFDDASDVAQEYLNHKGIEVVGRSENVDKGYILFSENFADSIKKV